MQIYLVGGAVRDQLLGVEPQDRDWVVVGSTPEEMVAQGYRPVGSEFPVFIHAESGEEYALARTERKSAPGYHGFTFHASPEVTLEEDLKRRDLTINAIAQCPDGTLIDPYNGQQDLQQGLLRHVSDAFREDPVRILRIARYASRFHHLGFRVAEATQSLMAAMVGVGEVDALVAERVWQELQRSLGEQSPGRFIEVLRECGALASILPELDRLFGVPQPEKHHPEIDTGVHTLLVLNQAAQLSNDSRVRFAALLHDLGKGTTPREEWPRHIAHESRGVTLVEQICERLRVPRDYRDLAVIVTRHHGLYHRAGELRAETMLKLLEGIDAFRRPERLEQFLLACEADSRGRPGFEQRDYPQLETIRSAYRAAAAVQVGTLIAEGYSGAELGQQLREQRIEAIALNRGEGLS